MVELKKDLPEIFEEFADQRRNSFLAIKKLKEQGVPVVGAFCTYLPKELPRAMGAAVVGLCSVSDETIPDAEKDLPRNLCPLIKSSYGFAKTDKCPFFYFSDLVVGETTCDGKKKMYEMLAEFKPVYVIELPNRQSEEGIAMYRREIIRFKEELERRFETTITEEAIRHEIHLNNEITKSLLRLQYLMANDPAPVSGLNIVNTAYGSGFNMDVESLPARINDLADQIEAEYAAGKSWRPTVRPPRLGGNERRGVFATRSPYRPNALGLSCVELAGVENGDLIVRGADLLDGTPIFDIKPYLPYVDAYPEARGGFTDTTRAYALQVICPDALLCKVPEEKRPALLGVLKNDPRPAYQHDPARVYALDFGSNKVKFTVDGENLMVIDIL